MFHNTHGISIQVKFKSHMPGNLKKEELNLIFLKTDLDSRDHKDSKNMYNFVVQKKSPEHFLRALCIFNDHSSM